MIRVDTCGQRILFPGDVYKKGSAVLLKNPEQLKSDIVQVSHHGFEGVTKAFYEAVNADVALWPTADYCVPALRELESNRYLLDESGVKEHIISGYGTRELPMPYHAVKS